MKVINFAETNSVINQYVAEIRDVNIQGDRMRFRRNIERIGELMAYEMSKELTYSVKQVQTPLGVAPVSTPDDDVVIATVFRAGLPLHQGFLNVFDRAGNAFVSAYRYYKDKECRELDVHIEYIATPDLTQKTLMLVDPMLATGESMELAYRAFLSKGRPARLLIACVIASRQGVEHHLPLRVQCDLHPVPLRDDHHVVGGLDFLVRDDHAVDHQQEQVRSDGNDITHCVSLSSVVSMVEKCTPASNVQLFSGLYSMTSFTRSMSVASPISYCSRLWSISENICVLNPPALYPLAAERYNIFSLFLPKSIETENLGRNSRYDSR